MINMWGIPPFKKIQDWSEWDHADAVGAYYLLDWDHVLKYISTAGFKGIELIRTAQIISEFGTAEKFTEFIGERGIDKVVGSFAAAIGSTDPSNWDEIITELEPIVKFVSDCGGENISLQPGGQYCDEGPMTEKKLKNVAECINRIGKMTADYSVLTSIHNEFWCIINSMWELETLLANTNPDHVSYCLDTAQVAIAGNDPIFLYEKYHDRIKYFHLKDTKYIDTNRTEYKIHGIEYPDDAKRWFWEMGTGIVDFPALYRLLKKYNYRGWVTIESDKSPNPIASTLLSRWYIDNVLSKIYQ